MENSWTWKPADPPELVDVRAGAAYTLSASLGMGSAVRLAYDDGTALVVLNGPPPGAHITFTAQSNATLRVEYGHDRSVPSASVRNVHLESGAEFTPYVGSGGPSA